MKELQLAALLVLGGISGSALACDISIQSVRATSAQPAPNVGTYVWNESQGVWVREYEAHLSSLLYDYVLEEGDIVEATGTYGDGGSGGGGGGGGGGGREIFLPQASSCDPVTLPPVTVTGTRPSFGGFGFMTRITSYYPSAGGGGGTWRVVRRQVANRADHPENQTDAVCTSDQADRHMHAAADFAWWRIKNFGAALRAGRGEIITVVYDDGGTERYQWIPGSIPASTRPPEIYLAPIPNSLVCPQ